MLLKTLVCLSCLSLAVSYDDEYTETSKTRKKRDLSGKTLRFVYILEDPYVRMSANNTFEGFIPDLVETLSRRLKFTYEAYLVPDSRYGAKDKEGNWNGMIKEVLDHTLDKTKGADIAAAPLTITAGRLDAVDFIKPFQHTGLAFLIKKPYKETDNPQDIMPYVFQVMGPFASEVWALTVVAFLVVAGLLWGFNYANPYEWGPRFQMGRASETQGNLFSLQGSLWFTFSTLQWQGYESAPRSTASRVLSCFWFAFVTLTLATYTGSLMNHLFWASTVHGKDLKAPPFHTISELLQNKDYSYGLIEGGSTYRYIRNNKRADFERMTAFLSSSEGKKNLFKSTKEAVKRVRQGKFAFIMEDMSARHHANQLPCDLMVAGEIFAPRSYGMAVSKHMDKDTSHSLHQAILELHEMGEIEALEQKWWIDKGECWNMTKFESEATRANQLSLNKPKQVTMHEFWGPLVLLVVGMILSILVSVAEIIYYRYRGRYHAGNRHESPSLKLDEDGTFDS